jgi:copper chaperone
MKNETFTIQGMSCDHCVRAVKGALEGIPGVEARRVEIGRAEVSYDETKVKRDALIRAVEEEGYQVVGG